AQIVGGEDEALAISPPAVEHLVGLLAKGPVSDRQDLVDEEEVAVELRGDRKGQALAHAGGELLHLCLDEVLELRKGDDLVEALLQLRPAKLVEEAWRPCAGHTELLGQTSDLDQRLHHQMCSATSAAK